MSAKALVIAGYGLNCEEETLYALEYNGLKGVVRHVNDLIDNPAELKDVQVLAVPGGFSYGDDTGSGNALGQKIKLSLMDALKEFVARDTLTIGICNGCQVLVNLGLVPALDGAYGNRDVAVTYNLSARYQCRWVDLKVSSSSPWLAGVEKLHIPVAHGEGRFVMEQDVLNRLQKNGQIAATYVKPDGAAADGEFPFNPNGAIADIAGMTDETGRVLAMMPHPERGMFSWQRDDYDVLKDQAQREERRLTEESDGMHIFANAAEYFEVAKKKIA